MKATFGFIGAVMLVAASPIAGQDAIIKQRAKELSNQNNVRQEVPPPTQPGVPAPGANMPAPPKLSVSLTKFQTDLGGITAGSPATEVQKQQLANELIAAAQGGKPSQAASAKFSDDLSAALAEKPLPTTSRARLVQELDAVLNPGKYPQAKLEGIFADIQAIFQANGLNRLKAVAIADDVKAISADIQKGGATK
jgi:hypothetical protein